MCPFWNVLFLECAFFGMCSFWNVLFLKCAFFGMCSFWNVSFLECAVFGMCLFLECALFGMCSFWNVLFLECALSECALCGISMYKFSPNLLIMVCHKCIGQLGPSQPGTIHFLIGKFSYFVIRFLY